MLKAVWDLKSSGDLENSFDCYIAEALLAFGQSIGTKDEVLEKYGVKNLEDLAGKQREKLRTLPKLESLFYEVEMPLIKVLKRMEDKGVLLDIECLKKTGREIEEQLIQVKEKISRETGNDLNINSPVQLGTYLAEKKGIPLGKTNTGKYATNEAELVKYKNLSPLIADILTFRELMKLKTTYVDSLFQKADKENLIHTTYNQVYVNTGRLASANPNLQNLPTNSEMGKKIKSCFIARPGYSFVSFDYSQQELRILAHMAQEKELQKAFAENIDIHSLTASRIFKADLTQVTKEQRFFAKTINFGIIYGMGVYGLSNTLSILPGEAEKFISQFYLSYPNIKTYYDNYLEQARINGYAETLLGRRRYVFENPKQNYIDNAMRRVLMNYPVQGTAADLMKKAMVNVFEKVLPKYPEVSLLLQIHDDLVFEVPDNMIMEKEGVISEIKSALCDVYLLSVPMEVEVKTGKQWGNLQLLKE